MIGSVILTRLPDLPPRPLTAANAAFRREFYRHWGRGNWIVAGEARRADYDRFRQTLSIKCVARGVETYAVDGRRVAVDDRTWLVLNERREYASELRSDDRRAYSFAIFFRPGMAAEVAGASARTLRCELDDGNEPAPYESVEFTEHLRPHGGAVTRQLQALQDGMSRSDADDAWLEEQLQLLLGDLLAVERREFRMREIAFADARPAARRELTRRLGWAADHLRANLHREVPLAELSRIACLSPFHLLRQFRRLTGFTPRGWHRVLRARHALQLRASAALDLSEIGARTGLSRTSLWRVLRSAGSAPDSDAVFRA